LLNSWIIVLFKLLKEKEEKETGYAGY